jgi:hypothetical protein
MEFEGYICGGYFVAKIARSYRKSEFLPSAIVTVSNCVTETLPDQWAIDWISATQEQRKEAAFKCGIDASDLKRFIMWTTERVNREEIGINNVIFSKTAAEDLLSTFVFDRTDWRLLALGLRKENLEEFLSSLEPTYQGPRTFGVHDAICRREAPDPAGEIIGYDVLGMNGYNEFHSWLCNLLEERVAAEFGIRPDANGLLATYLEAKACVEYIHRPTTGAEPVAWFPWAVISYPI